MDNPIRYKKKKLPLRLMHHCYRICCIIVTEGVVSLLQKTLYSYGSSSLLVVVKNIVI